MSYNPNFPKTTQDFIKSVEKYVIKDRSELLQKLYVSESQIKKRFQLLQSYTARLEEQLYALFTENDFLFERPAFRESMAIEARFKKIRSTQVEANVSCSLHSR